MGVTRVLRSPFCGQGVVETEAALAPRSLQIRLGRDTADGCKQMGSRKRWRGAVGLVSGPGLNSGPLNFKGITGSEAVLKKGVLGK